MNKINPDSSMNYDMLKKVSIKANIVLALFVFFMTGVFYHYGVTYMVYHSIPTLALYFIFFAVINAGKLDVYLWSVYAVIAVYMAASTICLGYNFGFHLYCMSMLPIIFYTEYMAHKINARKTRSFEISAILVAVYLASTGYSVINGPIYHVDNVSAEVFLFINSISVFAFLITYTSLMINMIISSEKKLEQMAHFDKLTGLANRHYQMEHLTNMENENNLNWLAILDIDKFKKINDTYGHNAGDYVLIQLSSVMNNVCKDCKIARWGGEEFLIVPENSSIQKDILEKLRAEVENHSFKYLDNNIPVTISIGVADFNSSYSIERWIQKADECLYESKNNGRNRITIK